jgi:hypothetical protein
MKPALTVIQPFAMHRKNPSVLLLAIRSAHLAFADSLMG